MYQLIYKSELPIHLCINKIYTKPWIYACRFGTELWYKCEIISDNKMIITFTGGQFRRIMRTQYILEFIEDENNTKIIMTFQNEILGLPALTPKSDIDLFMKQKLDATQVDGIA